MTLRQDFVKCLAYGEAHKGAQMNREPLNLPTPVLIVISVASIVLLLYLALYAISHETSRQKQSSKPYSGEDTYYNPNTGTTEFLSHPADTTISEEKRLRDTTQSEFERMHQETEQQLKNLKTEKDLSRSQKSLQTF